MRKTVYLVVKVQVETGSWRKDLSARQLAEDCEVEIQSTHIGQRVVGVEVLAASDKLGVVQNVID